MPELLVRGFITVACILSIIITGWNQATGRDWYKSGYWALLLVILNWTS